MDELRTRITELEAELADRDARLKRAEHERDQYQKLYELVTLELERVKRHLRAQNQSERVDAAQVQMAFKEVANLVVPTVIAEQIARDENAEREKKKTAPPHGRNRLPEHLIVERIEVEPPEALRTCSCCGNAMKRIGEEIGEKLDYRPGSFVRVQTARIKYACACDQGGVVIAEVPDAPVDKGLAGPGLLAHVAISKYQDHLPLYRLEDMLAREGVTVARSTMGDWVEQVADLLSPIANAMSRAMISAHRIHTDDTGIPILQKGKTRNGHVWVYVADDDHIVFRYTPRRRGDGPREFLQGYKGYVQADAANLYDRLFGEVSEGAQEVGCWAHARRYFIKAQLSDSARALVALGFVKELYKVDDAVSAMPERLRTTERARLATPLLDAFKTWLDAQALLVLPKAPIALAIGYVRNQWPALVRFVDDSRLKLDNNTAERALRRVAIGRKNWLFAGTNAAAERSCVIYSLLASCRMHNVNPFDYLRDVLMRVSSHPAADVIALTPKLWKQREQNLDAS